MSVQYTLSTFPHPLIIISYYIKLNQINFIRIKRKDNKKKKWGSEKMTYITA